ncbi:probable acyl-activating enzyme 17, peroxisomal [Phragmites australis]|uniref:probable acyl-activating enzyme 17, peroxisomal n=1 Tax=Phragmites australis TaxID=29695 RepID=UPI002D784C26|nr:probable acyl-activating enzyme 17, peroxisomal [Phragmites australis]
MAAAAHKPLGAITAADLAAVAPGSDAAALHTALRCALDSHGSAGAGAVWGELCRFVLRPDVPFAIHRMVYYGCFAEFPSPTPPAWTPDPEAASLTNVGRVLEARGKELIGEAYKDPITSFPDLHKFSNENPEVYWKTVFDEMGVEFNAEPSCILKESGAYPGGEWLPDAVLNAAANCLSAKPGRSSDDAAIVWRDEGKDSEPLNFVTLEELRKKVCLVANALDALDLPKGSAIAIDMPMNVNAVVIYLAIVLAGYVVVSIADSFAAPAISTRLKISEAKAIFTQDYILRDDKELPLYSRVVEAKAPMAIVIPVRGSLPINELRVDDLSWQDFLGRVNHTKAENYIAVEQPAHTFSNILFSSGTTGEPKAIPWTHITPLKAAADGWCHMDIRKGDVVAWPTNLGWMMGPWLVYASLLNGASMALYNGSPNSSGFAKFVQDAKVTMLGVVPSIVRTWKTTDCTAGFDWSTIRCFSSTGEASSVDDYLWLMGRACYKPVIEYCGGTEIGGAFVTGSLLQPQALSAFSTPAMGCNLFILDSSGNPLPQDAVGIGELALDPTLFGSSSTLLNADHYDVYFKGMAERNGKVLRRHGDEFECTSDGYYRAHGRADDTMNLGGIKVSSIEIERICNRVNDAILETAAIGVPPIGGGPEQLTIAVVFEDHNSQAEDLNQLKLAFNSALKKLNPLFKVSSVVVVPSLPRTASNKVMRRVLRKEFTQATQAKQSKI